MKSWSLADIKDHADAAETWPGRSGVLDWGEIAWRALVAWVELSAEIGGDATLPECDVDSVRGCFERWWRLQSQLQPSQATGCAHQWTTRPIHGGYRRSCILCTRMEDITTDEVTVVREGQNAALTGAESVPSNGVGPLPCPFCGKPPEWIEMSGWPGLGGYECRNHECYLVARAVGSQSSLEQWNRRANVKAEGSE